MTKISLLGVIQRDSRQKTPALSEVEGTWRVGICARGERPEESAPQILRKLRMVPFNMGRHPPADIPLSPL